MSEFKPIRTTSSNLSSISVADGQFILTTDTGCIYVDFGNTRVQVGIAVNQGSGNSGKYLTVNSSGVVTNSSFPVASTLIVGGIKVDGSVTTVNSSNQLEINKNSLVAGSGTNSIAIGNNVAQYGSGNSSVAIGNGSSAMIASDVAIGTESYANGGIAIGYNSFAEGSSSTGIAIGHNATANGGGIQLGTGTTSSNTFSVAAYSLLNLNTGQIPYQRLPYGTTSTVGAVKVDNSTIKVDANGKISASDQLSSVKTTANAGKYLTINSNKAVVATDFPVASTSNLGGIKVDGTITSIDNTNQLQISKNALLAGTGTDSIAIGTGGSSGTGCIFIGTGTTGEATGKGSIAIGFAAEALSAQDIAFGSFASAEGISVGNTVFPSLAIGYNAVASNGSIQIGYGSNNTTGALNVGFRGSGNYCLLTSSGIIPKDRLPIADTVNQGAVKIDGSSITIDSNGVISAANPLSTLMDPSNEGKYLVIDADGDIDVADLPLYNGGVS